MGVYLEMEGVSRGWFEVILGGLRFNFGFNE